MDWHELQKKKVDELRALAKEKAGLEGTTGLRKDQLVEVVAKALGIDKPHLVVQREDRLTIKQKIRTLKAEATSAREANDGALAKRKRRQIHALKRQIRKAAHLTH